MMGEIIGYKGYALATMVVISIVLGQYVRIQQLKAEVEKTKAELVVAEVNQTTLANVIEDQNGEIEKIAVDLKSRNEEYTKLLNQPEKVRYRGVYETVGSIGVKSDECEDIKKLIDDIRSAGY